MTVSMGIKHHGSGAYDVIPIATSECFAQHWLPACARLGLRLVPHFHDGALSEIVVELEALRAWAARADNTAFMLAPRAQPASTGSRAQP